MDVWLNEALSESTSLLFSKSIEDMRVKSFNETPYYSFYSWYFKYSKDNDIFETPLMEAASYAPASVFMKWIDGQTGGNQEIYKKIASSANIKDGEQRLLDSVKALNSNLGTDMDTLLFNWIKGVNNGDIKDINNAPQVSDLASASDKAYNYFIKNGQTQLLPRALIICSKQDADKITDTQVKKEALGNNVIVLNARKNQNPGYTSASDIVPISLTRTAVSSSKYNNITELTMFKKGYFIDRVITEKDITKIKNIRN